MPDPLAPSIFSRHARFRHWLWRIQMAWLVYKEGPYKISVCSCWYIGEGYAEQLGAEAVAPGLAIGEVDGVPTIFLHNLRISPL